MLSACQADLFEDVTRWPRRPYCSDDLASGLRIRSLSQAIHRRYIQANPPHLRVWILADVDYAGGILAWESAGLPPPAWGAANRENAHAHLAWGLSAPVLVDGLGARDAPMRYLCAVESMMWTLLRADPGYRGLITKNPRSPFWRILRGPRLAYELGELAEYLPGLEKHIPRRRRPEEVGIGRNVTLFDTLRKWAYSAIRVYWGGGLQGWNAWLAACQSRALIYNGDFRCPLDEREVWHVARSVCKWAWRNLSQQGFSEWQAAQGHKGGLKGGVARSTQYEDKRASARLMAASGMTQGAIAAELGVTDRAVRTWLRDET